MKNSFFSRRLVAPGGTLGRRRRGMSLEEELLVQSIGIVEPAAIILLTDVTSVRGATVALYTCEFAKLQEIKLAMFCFVP